jgi:hypothetical protein
MTDIQTSLPILIVRPSILNPVINFSTHLWPVKWNAWLYLCLAHFIPSPPISMQHMHQLDQQRYDPLHIITWPYWFNDLDLTCSSLLPSSIDAMSCSSFTATQSICGRTARNNTLSETLVYHYTLSILKMSYFRQSRRAHPTRELKTFRVLHLGSNNEYELTTLNLFHTA